MKKFKNIAIYLKNLAVKSVLLLIATPVVSVFTYLFVCLGCSIYMEMHPLVSPQDIQNASWLSSPTTALHFQGFLGTALIGAALIMGLAISYAKSSIVPFLVGLIWSSALFFSSSSAVVYETGIYTRTIKIGCYVWDLADCQEMIGATVDKLAIKKYPKTDTFDYTPEYKKALDSVDKPNAWLVALGSVPGGYFLMSPFALYNRADVHQKILSQQSELNTYLQAHSEKVANKPK